MDDFSEDEDQQFFDHINEDSNDQSDDEGVGRPMTPPSPPLQYRQPRCPVDLNFDHLPHCKRIRQTQSHIYCNKDPIPTSNT